MGDPRKHRKKYETPRHPWEKDRIEAERELFKEYGLANKKEIYRMNSKLKSLFAQAKKLVAQSSDQSDKETKLLLARLAKLGLLSSEAQLPDVLTLNIRDIMDRRLQTMVLKKMLASSPKQARQFITHKHITVSGKIVTAPSYMVSLHDEATIGFTDKSALSEPDHPERVAASDKNKEEPLKKEEAKS